MLITKIIIGIDDSKYAENAARYGFELARKLNASVGVVHIIEPVAAPLDTSDNMLGMPIAPVTTPETIDLVHAPVELADRIIDRVVTEYGTGLQVTQFSEYGSTTEGILECSKEFNADLIVLGTHKRSGFDRWLMGSISEGIVRRAEIPVLVVPFKEE